MGHILTDVTTERVMQREQDLARDVARLAMQSKNIEVSTPENLVVRDILPAVDLNSGGDNGWTTADDEWRQDYSTAASADAYNEAYEIDSDGNADGKIIGILGVSFLHADIVTRQIRFGIGVGGNQGIKREFQVEGMEVDRESRGLFATDVVYGAEEDGNISHWVDAAEDGKRAVFHGVVAEPVEQTLSVAVNPLLSERGGEAERTLRESGSTAPAHRRSA